jgi:hypothetical protein
VTPLEISDGVSVLSFSIYSVLPRTRSFAVAPRVTRGALVARVEGDLLELPSPLTVRVLMDEPSLVEAYDAAYALVAFANAASQVTSYEGVVLVNGLVRASIDVESPSLFVTLSFALVGS